MAIRECNTVNAIQAVNKHVQAAITMLEALREDSDKILTVKISPNANSERQTTFFSIKKTKTTFSKPSRQDSNLCKSEIARESLYLVVLVLNRMTVITLMLKSAGFSVISVLCGFIYHAHYQNLHTHL